MGLTNGLAFQLVGILPINAEVQQKNESFSLKSSRKNQRLRSVPVAEFSPKVVQMDVSVQNSSGESLNICRKRLSRFRGPKITRIPN